MSIEDFIRERARMDWSRNMVALALGISFRKLTAMLDTMPEIQWPAPGQSADCKRAYSSRVSSERFKEMNKRKVQTMQRRRYEKQPRYNVGGFIGTSAEVYAHWTPLVSVSLCQFRRRLKCGQDVYTALFKPSQVHTGWGHMPKMHLRRA